MKKALAAFLALLALVSLFSGCVKKTYTLPWDQFCYKADGGFLDLGSTERTAVINLLNGGDWEDGILDYTEDYCFYPTHYTLHYCSREGVFNDLTRNKHLALNDEAREQMNGILKISNETKETKKPEG